MKKTDVTDAALKNCQQEPPTEHLDISKQYIDSNKDDL